MTTDTPHSGSSSGEGQWIVNSLKEFFNAKIAYERQVADERDRYYSKLFENIEKNVVVALQSITERLNLLNESRQTIGDMLNSNPTRNETDAKFDSIQKDLRTINSRLDTHEGRGKGKQDIWGYFIGAFGIIAGIVVALVKR